jgi:hypothetical protein
LGAFVFVFQPKKTMAADNSKAAGVAHEGGAAGTSGTSTSSGMRPLRDDERAVQAAQNAAMFKDLRAVTNATGTAPYATLRDAVQALVPFHVSLARNAQWGCCFLHLWYVMCALVTLLPHLHVQCNIPKSCYVRRYSELISTQAM